MRNTIYVCLTPAVDHISRHKVVLELLLRRCYMKVVLSIRLHIDWTGQRSLFLCLNIAIDRCRSCLVKEPSLSAMHCLEKERAWRWANVCVTFKPQLFCKSRMTQCLGPLTWASHAPQHVETRGIGEPNYVGGVANRAAFHTKIFDCFHHTLA